MNPPAREMYGELQPIIVGHRLVLAQVVTDPDEQAALEQWEAEREWFREQVALHPDSPLDHYGEVWEPANRWESLIFQAIVFGCIFALGAIITILIRLAP